MWSDIHWLLEGPQRSYHRCFLLPHTALFIKIRYRDTVDQKADIIILNAHTAPILKYTYNNWYYLDIAVKPRLIFYFLPHWSELIFFLYYTCYWEQTYYTSLCITVYWSIPSLSKPLLFFKQPIPSIKCQNLVFKKLRKH